MDTLLQDLRYAVRTLAKAPGFAAVAILTLAIGIGANTAIFSAIDSVLLKPLPFPDGDRLVQINSVAMGNAKFAISYPDLLDLRGLTVFSGVAASASQRYNLTGAGEPLEVQAASVTADLFPVLGVTPEIGRMFTASDERAPVALISHGLWVTNFGSDPTIVGKPIALDGKSYTIVGVMRAAFHYPDDAVKVWTPIGDALAQQPGAETTRNLHFFTAVARLAPRATYTQAVAALDVLGARINAEDSVSRAGGSGGRQMIGISINGPGTPPGPPNGGQRAAILNNSFAATPLRDVAVGDTRRPLFILFGAVGLVLLIACVNAANLLLARATARRREMALRQALGAERGRLVRQLLTESVLLSLAAAAVGSLLALWGIRALVSIWPRALPGGSDITVDWRISAFTFGLALLTGLVFGLIPAWRASAPQIEETLREDSAGTTGSRRRRLQGGLVIAEITVALVLLVGAGLLVKSFIRLSDVNPGFDTQDLLAARVRLTPTRYASGPAQTQFFDQLLTNLSGRPGVQSASIAGTLPWSGSFRMLAFDPRSVKPDYPDPFMVLGSFVVSPDYFQAFRIPIRRGRAFTADDRVGAPAVAIVNQATVKQLWPGQDPIGKQIPLGRPGSRGPTIITVVGVIDDIRSAGLDATPRPEIYTPAAQESSLDQMWVVFRAANGKPLQMAGVIRDAVHQADPEQPIGEIASLTEMGDRLTAARRPGGSTRPCSRCSPFWPSPSP